VAQVFGKYLAKTSCVTGNTNDLGKTRPFTLITASTQGHIHITGQAVWQFTLSDLNLLTAAEAGLQHGWGNMPRHKGSTYAVRASLGPWYHVKRYSWDLLAYIKPTQTHLQEVRPCPVLLYMAEH